MADGKIRTPPTGWWCFWVRTLPEAIRSYLGNRASVLWCSAAELCQWASKTDKPVCSIYIIRTWQFYQSIVGLFSLHLYIYACMCVVPVHSFCYLDVTWKTTRPCSSESFFLGYASDVLRNMRAHARVYKTVEAFSPIDTSKSDRCVHTCSVTFFWLVR